MKKTYPTFKTQSKVLGGSIAWNAGLNLQYTSEDFRKARPGKVNSTFRKSVDDPDWNYQYLEVSFTDHMKMGNLIEESILIGLVWGKPRQKVPCT